jgi:D-alanyl-D-alanine carboxypeptidase
VLRRSLLALFVAVIAVVGGVGFAPVAPPPVGDGGSVVAAASPVAIRDTPDVIRDPRPRVAPPPVAPIGLEPRVPNGPSATARTRNALQRALDRLRAKYAMPGLSATIIFADGTTWTGVSGLADVQRRTPVTAATSFAIASVSKTFTSALVLALSDEGKVALDEPVSTYLPALRLDPKTTVRQLLDHTSGLSDYFFHPLIDEVLLRHRDRKWDEAEALKYVGRPYFKPGKGWHYSNTNYLVLGLLAEAVDDAPIDEQIRTRFLDPLGLGRTFYQGPEIVTGSIAHGYRFNGSGARARPIDLSDGTGIAPFRSVVTAAAGAGSIASSSADVARWARSLYGGSVLPHETLETMILDLDRTEPYRPSVPYGLGVQVVDIDGRVTLGHSGRLLGFRSVMRWLPEEGIAIAVLTNQSRTDPGLVARALLKLATADRTVCDACGERR